jgi:hypothetical protein
MQKRSRRCERCFIGTIRPPRRVPELVIAALFACIIGCASRSDPPLTAIPETGYVAISPEKHGFFIAGTTERFVPWGFNYDRDFKSRLIEDYWEKDWATVEQDFHEMKTLGANVVRVHLQFAKFMDAPNRPNRTALFQLDRLLSLAQRERIYLDLTGLACYRKSDVPAWYDALSEQQRWAAQAAFWDAIAQRCASSPAVFCYDLINEPLVPAAPLPKGQWLHPYALGGFNYVQYIALDAAGRPRTQIAKQWAHQISAAIRKRDRSHLVTVGLLPNSVGTTDQASGFDPTTIAVELDFISVHIYPTKEKVAESIETLRGFCVGKPVVIEEMFPLNCSADELGQFVEQSRSCASGWLGFYWGQTPEQLKTSKRPGDALMLSWLELFTKLRTKIAAAN